jgi:hypothetical protein
VAIRVTSCAWCAFTAESGGSFGCNPADKSADHHVAVFIFNYQEVGF